MEFNGHPLRPRRFFCAYSKQYRDFASSGGICTELAGYVFGRGGLAFGAAYAPDFRSVRTIGVDNMHDWLRLVSKSKYAECENADFSCIGKILESGRYVLFVGCPCQVKALIDEVGCRYGNLITVDMRCHGYCSADVLRGFVDRLESGHGKRVVSLDMRPAHKVWFRCVFENGSVFEDDSVHGIFVNGANLIDRCRGCDMKYAGNASDITVGDFWEYPQFKNAVNERFKPCFGTNWVKVNTVRGMEAFELLKSRLECTEIFRK